MSFNPTSADIQKFGQSGQMIDELTGKLIKVHPIATDMDKIVSGIEKMGVSLEKLGTKFKPTAQQLNKPKFQKSVSSLGSMFKTMSGLSPKAYILQKLIEVLSPLMKLFEVFQPILDAISALLTIMVVSAMKPLFKVLTPLVPKIMELAPLFAEIGTIIGELLVIALDPLLELFDAYKPVLIVLLRAFADLLIAFKPLMPFLVQWNTLLAKILVVLAPLITKMVQAYVNTEAFKFLLNLLVNAFQVLNPLLDSFLGWIRDIANTVSNLTGGSTGGGGGGSTGGGGLVSLVGGALNAFGSAVGGILSGFGFAQSGGTTSRPTIVSEIKGQREEIIPLDRQSVVLDELREVSYQLAQIRAISQRSLEAQESQGGIKIYRNVHG